MATRRNTGFYIDAPYPIDGRMRVNIPSDLNAIPIKYDRMVTHVISEDKDYRYYASTNTWVPLNYSGAASWGTITGDINAQTDLINKFSNYSLVGHTHPQQPPLPHTHVTGDILDDGFGNVVWDRNLVAPDFILVGSSGSEEEVIDRTWILTDGTNTSDIASNTTVLFGGGFSFDSVNKVVTYNETDPTVPDYVKAISETDISNWDSAYAGLIYKADITYVDAQDAALDHRIDLLENPDRVIKYGDLTFSGMNILIAAKEFEWVASGITTSDSPEVVAGQLVMTPCDPGKYRFVLLQGNPNGTYSIKEGLQSSTVAQIPTPDAGTIALVAIHLFESTVLGYEDVLSEIDALLDLKEDKINKGAANGYAPLDSNAKVPLANINDALLGNVHWKGLYNGTIITSSPDPSLVGQPLPAPSSSNMGWYFISTANYTYGGADYRTGDWIISDGTTWSKVDNTDAVSSVFTRTGAITAQNGDYTASQITNVPAGSISSITVQAALNELDVEKIPSARTININGVIQDLSADRQWRAGLANTGALTYAGATTASATTINVGAVTGIITNNETTPGIPSYQLVSYAGGTNITVPTISGGTGTYVLLNNAGALVFQNTFPTSAQRKTMIYLSKVSHPNLSSISFVIDEVDFVTSPLQQFRDLFQVIQYMNQGIKATPNAGLTINTSNGSILGDGINFVINRADPNFIPIAAGAPRNFLLLNQSGAVGSFITAIDPTTWDNVGVTTPVGGGTNNTTIQYLYYAPGVGFAIQRGQTVYPSLVDAVAAVGRENFVVRANLVNNSILIAALVLRHTTTNMNDPAFVRILPADKFGQLGGASSGISVTSLQTAYNNSLIPQIQTTIPLGAVTIKEGGAANTDNVFAVQNLAGVVTMTVDGNGRVTSGSTTLNDLPPTANNHLVRKDYLDSKIPTNYSKIVYVNNVNPNSATIFDTENPPVTNDNALKANTDYLYIGTDASTWVYNGSTYITKPVTSTTSNFYLIGGTIDAGSDKTSSIYRTGGLGLGAVTTLKAKLSIYTTQNSRGTHIESNLTPDSGITMVQGIGFSQINAAGSNPGYSVNGYNVNAISSTGIVSQVAQTADVGIIPAVVLQANRNTDAGVSLGNIINRPILGVYNYATQLFQIAANGNVSIGTTSATDKLTVNGAVNVITSDARIKGGDNTGRLIVSNASTTSYIELDGSTNSTPNKLNLLTTTGAISLITASNERLTVLNNGLVGINSTAPINQFEVKVVTADGSSSSHGIAVHDGAANRLGLSLGVNTAGLYSWLQSTQGGIGQKALVLNPIGGNVGIGTSGPNRKLEVQDLDTQFSIKATNVGNPTYQQWTSSTNVRRGYFGFPSQGVSDIRLVNEETGGHIAIMPTGAGNVGIGTTTPTKKLEIIGDGRFTKDIVVEYPAGGGVFAGTTNNYLSKSAGNAPDFNNTVILLHPVYVGVNITHYECKGRISVRRGSSSASLRDTSINIETATSFNENHYFSEIQGGNTTAYSLVTCDYLGVKYVALKFDAAIDASARNFGFDGYIQGDANALLVINYFNTNTSTVLNAEVNGSIASITYNLGKVINSSTTTINSSTTVIPNGNVGIGTPSPGAKLDIFAKANGSGIALKVDTNTRAIGEDYIWFGDATIPDFLINTNGNIGIGQPSPISKLDIVGVGTTTYTASSGSIVTNFFKLANAHNSGGNDQFATMLLQVTGNNGVNSAYVGLNAIQPTAANNATDFALTVRQTGGAMLEALRVTSTGVVKIPNLAGTGTRTVVADASGNLSATAVLNKSYKAQISQTSTSAPTLTVAENSIGTITWTRTAAGEYTGTSAGLFTLGKTTISTTNGDIRFSSAIIGSYIIDVNTVIIRTIVGGTPTDGQLYAGCVQINVAG